MFDNVINRLIRPRKYKIGLSFSGDHRAYVRAIANGLKVALNSRQIEEWSKNGPCSRYAALKSIGAKNLENKVLYDDDFDDEFSISDLKRVLPNLYLTECDLNAVFISERYASKASPWCLYEWAKIDELIKKESQYRAMLIFIGNRDKYDTTLRKLGLSKNKDGLIDFNKYELDEAIEKIHARYQFVVSSFRKEILIDFVDFLRGIGDIYRSAHGHPNTAFREELVPPAQNLIDALSRCATSAISGDIYNGLDLNIIIGSGTKLNFIIANYIYYHDLFNINGRELERYSYIKKTAQVIAGGPESIITPAQQGGLPRHNDERYMIPA